MRLRIFVHQHGMSQGHSKWITSIAWEPAHLALPSRRFVTGSKDTSIRVWDAVTRQTLFSMSSHTLAVSCVKWGGDGLIYSASKDCTINVWSGAVRICIPHDVQLSHVPEFQMHGCNVLRWQDGKMVRTLRGHGHWVNTLALSSEFMLRTGPFDHHGRAPADVQAAKEARTVRNSLCGSVARVVPRKPNPPCQPVLSQTTSADCEQPRSREYGCISAGHRLTGPCAQAARERYNKAVVGRPERLVSGSDDFTMFMWEPSTSKAPVARMTGHMQLINQARS